MMQMMMATSMTHNSPISNIALNIQDSAATGIEKSVGLYEGVNAEENCNTEQHRTTYFSLFSI